MRFLCILQTSKCLHSYSGTHKRYDSGLLAHGMGAKIKCYCDDDKVRRKVKGLSAVCCILRVRKITIELKWCPVKAILKQM